MKFTPRLLTDNVNVSKTHPLVELGWLVGGLVLAVGIVFSVLGLLADWVATRTPLHVEEWLGQQALQKIPATDSPLLNNSLAGLMRSLPADSSLHRYSFQVLLTESDEVNAIALPGGNIIVFSGLLAQIESENELAMILAHEMGHFAHRDHLRGMGRGLGLVVAATLLFGEDSMASNLVVTTMMSFQASYSQEQEAAADRFGLELLDKRYGHVGGATDFFRRLAKGASGNIPYLLASHPHPAARIAALEALTAERKYKVAGTEQLPDELKEVAK